MYSVVDLSTARNLLPLWYNVQQQIQESSDLLKENYLNLNPADFLSFPAVIKDNKIICVSGLQSDVDKWGQGVARCSARMWIDPKYRFTGGTRFTAGPKFLNSYYCLPIQIQVAKKLGYDCLFISRSENPKAFREYGHLVNANTNSRFKMLDGMYNVCGNLDLVPVSCRQYIMLDFLTSVGPLKWTSVMEGNKL
jgi:hypothetical protein